MESVQQSEPDTQDACSSTCRPGHELIYEFSEYTCTLNEMEDGIAPTDSRLRPDQRIMENGDFDGANTEKVYRRRRRPTLFCSLSLCVVKWYISNA